MPDRKAREQVAMRSPSANPFTVVVSPARAEILRGRGYTESEGQPTRARSSASPTRRTGATPGGEKRAGLIARAKELGIPAKGSNADLGAAIEAAEKQA